MKHLNSITKQQQSPAQAQSVLRIAQQLINFFNTVRILQELSDFVRKSDTHDNN